jgi:hypothetical protein
MATKKKPKPEGKSSAMVVVNLRTDAIDVELVEELVAELKDPYKKGYVLRAAFKRGLQGLLKSRKADAVRRAANIKFGG